MERCTIVVNARDRFSIMASCLQTLFANTPEPLDLIVVVGGAPEHLRQQWLAQFGDKGRFIFTEHFLNQAQARNIGMREAKTRLAVLLDNDNFVRPGWLEALVCCQKDTGAVMVVPIILDGERRIHTAGNDLYITHEKGESFGHKHCRFYGKVFCDGSNLRRQPTDYGELHCQLVEVEPTLRLGAFDEKILEVGEVDSGLTWAKAGLKMYFEPNAVSYYRIHSPITVDDIRLFAWRWDIGSIHEGYEYFKNKWGLDIGEHGAFRDWLVRYNDQLGLLPRLWPSHLSLMLERLLRAVRARVAEIWRIPQYRYRHMTKVRLGYFKWSTGITP